MIGLFSLLAFPFSLKLLWMPLIDKRHIPFFSHAPRKGWMLFSLLGMALSMLVMAAIDPQRHPWLLASSLFTLSSFTGCLYMVGLAYELESIDESKYSVGSASVITGYRVGLLCAGAGSLSLAYLTNWSIAYGAMAALLGIVIAIILMRPEPYQSQNVLAEKRKKQGFLKEIIIEPCKSFFQNQDYKAILAIVLLFKAGDHITKAMEGPFYIDIGFDKADLALASKTWGFATTILGTLLAGFILKDRPSLFGVAIVGLVHAFSLLGLWLQALVGKSYLVLYSSVTLSSFTSGMSMTAFIFFLWRICTKQHAAIQYAILYSIFTIKTNLLSCFGGFLAAHNSWSAFFGAVFVMAIFASITIVGLSRKLVLFPKKDSVL